MQQHTQTLWQLVIELFTTDQQARIRSLTDASVPNLEALIAFDDSPEGPSISRMNCQNHGRYEIDDRDIFRPLQYCGMYFKAMTSKENIEDPLWLTRDIVEMSSLHIEGLIKRIGNVLHLPLGTALRNAIVERKLDPATWTQIEVYTRVYNDAKHNFSHAKDTHMFSVEDAILAYLVCRKLAIKLYPLANLVTDIQIFEKECDEAEIA